MAPYFPGTRVQVPPAREPAHSQSEVTPYDEQIRRVIRQEESKRKENDARIERKITAIKHGQFVVGTLVTLLGIYLTWLTTSQSDRNGRAGAAAASAYLATELPRHLKSTEEIARVNAREGAHEFYLEWQRAQNPQPLKSSPDTLRAAR